METKYIAYANPTKRNCMNQREENHSNIKKYNLR